MLWLCGTPIGNLGDASARLREVLASASVIAAEDTRRAGLLLSHLGISRGGGGGVGAADVGAADDAAAAAGGPGESTSAGLRGGDRPHADRTQLVALHDHNERDRAAQLAKRALTEDVALITDAGMPTVSDPGYRVVQQAIAVGAQVTVVPGPSAVLAGLALSGLPTDRFTFEGFLPRKGGERARLLQELATERRTQVYFEAPTRLAATLQDLADAFGSERRAAVCRELTKLHEEVRRGSLAELAEWAAGGVRGEIVVVVAGHAGEAVDASAATERVLALVAGGARLKDACRQVAYATGLSVRDLYQQALAAEK